MAVLGTFLQWMLLASFFLAKSTLDALNILGHMFVFSPGAELATQFVLSPFPIALAMYTVYGLLFVDIPWLRLPSIRQASVPLLRRTPTRVALYVACFIAAIAFTPGAATPFMYFQF